MEIADEEFFVFEIEPTIEDDDIFPRTYAASLGAASAPNFPGPYSTCSAVSPKCDASVRLTANDTRFGRLSVQINFYDNYHNYPGIGSMLLEGPVNLAPNVATRINQIGGTGYCVFHGAQLTAPTMMQIAFSVPWAARKNGRVCFSGVIQFGKRWVTMTRVGLIEEGDDTLFGLPLDAD